MGVKTDKPMVLRDSLFFVAETLDGMPGANLAMTKAIARRIASIEDVDQARTEVLRLAAEEFGVPQP